MMKVIKSNLKGIIAFLFMFAVVYILKDAGTMKYLILLGVSGLLFLYGIRSFEKEQMLWAIPPAIYILGGMIANCIHQTISFQVIKEILFVTMPLIAAISFFMSSKKLKIDFLPGFYWAMIIISFLEVEYFSKDILLESQYAFVFGVFLLYFYMIKKDLKYVVITTIMMYLMNKRIAILAVMLIVVLYEIIMMLVRKMPNWKEKVFKILSIGSVIIFVGYVLAICVLNLEGHFIQLLTSGRNVAWEAVKEHYGLSVFWLGRGLGDVVNTLGVLQIPSYTTNLHNDLLKVFIESGLLGSVIWVISHFAVCRWISKNKGIQFKQTLFLYLVIIYTMLNYTTDNIMIYINYWFPAYLILLTVISSEEKNETEENRNTKREIRLRLGVILALGVCVLGYLISAYIDYHNPSKITVPEEAIQVNSPDGRSVKVSVWERNGQPYYRIRYGGQNLINPSILGVETSEYTIGKDVVLENTVCYEIFEEEDVKADEDNPLGMPCRQAFIEMHEKDHQVVLEMRVYDSAVAFRYILDAGAQDVRELTRMSFLKWSKIDIHDEKSGLITTQLRENGLKVKSFVLPVKVYNSTGNEMVVSEVTEEGSTISVMSKTNWQKYMVDVEYKEGLNSLEGEVLKTPWRMFEFNQNEALKEEGGW